MTLAALVLAWSTACASTAAWAFVRSRGRAARLQAEWANVLLLRPCAGDEPYLAEALASSGAAPPGSRIRILVATASDPAAAVAQRVCVELARAGADACLMVTDACAANRKAAQLAAGVDGDPLGPPIVLVVDSDVVLTREVVADLTAPIAAGEVAAAWAPPVEIAPRTVGDRASANVLGASLHAFALLSALDRRGMVGKAFAIRRDALDAVGGFSALTGVLGEDMELARRLRAAGLAVGVTARPAFSLATGRSWGSTTERFTRWLAVLRAQRPALLVAYPIVLAAAPIQLALAMVGLARDEPLARSALASVVAVRSLIAVLARARSGLGAGDVLLAPWLADVALLVAFVRALCTRSVRWRGVSLRVARGTPLVEVDP